METHLSADATEAQWRALRTKPKSEHLAARYLQTAGFPAYCPQLRHQKNTTRGLVWYVEALFPGYVFAQFSKTEARHVRSINFVSGLLEFTPDWGVVPWKSLEALQEIFPDSQPHTVQILPEIGDEVELVTGPWKGAAAVVAKVLPGIQRIQILMDFLGSPRQMEVPLHTLLGFRDPRVCAFAEAP